ncbi:MAG: hypothetical protein ACN6N0_12385 [Microvirgula sp.]
MRPASAVQAGLMTEILQFAPKNASKRHFHSVSMVINTQGMGNVHFRASSPQATPVACTKEYGALLSFTHPAA